MRTSPEGGRTRRRWVLTLIAGSAIVVAACSATGTAPSGTTPTTTGPPAAIESEEPAPSASESSSGGRRGDYGYEDPPAASSGASPVPAGATVSVSTATGPLGTYLTGADGLTLYTFKPDGANTSTCDGGCAEAWPPFTVGPDVELAPGDGLDGELTTFARADGTLQVAYDGAPLYYFANDTTPGDTNGQGLGGNWFVAQA
jgi:predicted lipoprotein with Yx(FWY)xxD motif